jgi:hypothetical protein
MTECIPFATVEGQALLANDIHNLTAQIRRVIVAGLSRNALLPLCRNSSPRPVIGV